MRARNIKPDFFKNEHLAGLSFQARLLFIGLWAMADREGRLEDRPAKIKAEIFPYDDINVEPLLEDLHHCTKDLLLRYEVLGKRYIQIVKFSKHQRPHQNEAPSLIPPPSADYGETCNHGDKHLQPWHTALRPERGMMNDERGKTKDERRESPADAGLSDLKESSKNDRSQPEASPPFPETPPAFPAPQAISLDANDPAWGDGLKLLVSSGLAEVNARSFLGRLLKQYGKPAVDQAVGATLVANPAEPRSYLKAILERLGEKKEEARPLLQRLMESAKVQNIHSGEVYYLCDLEYRAGLKGAKNCDAFVVRETGEEIPAAWLRPVEEAREVAA